VKEWMKYFIAFVSALTGIILIIANGRFLGYYLPSSDYWENGFMRAIIGILLLGGAVTYFWTKSKFYKG
jgi:uncharacterized membrane protein